MYHEYTQEQLRSYCRVCIESLEIWARRLIHEKMIEMAGENYIDKKDENGDYLVNKKIRLHVHNMMKKDSGRFKTYVDTLFMDDLIYFLCNQQWYNQCFKEALKYVYPQGPSEAREFLKRIVNIRNCLSHSNPISIRQVEQVICYCNDFIEGLKVYYKMQGKEQVWNVPRIIKVRDSLGNVFENPVDHRYGGSNFWIEKPLHLGDSYSVEVDVDVSFTKDEYSIIWKRNGTIIEENKNNNQYHTTFSIDDIGVAFVIDCIIVSNKPWHKYSNHDGEIHLTLQILPPL